MEPGANLDALKATPMRLRLVEVPERALKDDQVEVLPPLGQLGALHKRLAAVAMGKLNEEQKRSQDRRAAELAAETASNGEPPVRSEADVTAQKEETRALGSSLLTRILRSTVRPLSIVMGNVTSGSSADGSSTGSAGATGSAGTGGSSASSACGSASRPTMGSESFAARKIGGINISAPLYPARQLL